MQYGRRTVQWIVLSCFLLTNINLLIDWRMDAKPLARAHRRSPSLKELARGSSKDERISVIVKLAGGPGAGFDIPVSIGRRFKHPLKKLSGVLVGDDQVRNDTGSGQPLPMSGVLVGDGVLLGNARLNSNSISEMLSARTNVDVDVEVDAGIDCLEY